MNRTILLALLACVAVLACITPASASLVGFQSDDHKVGCYLNGESVRCDVDNPKWEAQRPPVCELDWGLGVSVGRRHPGGYVCASDTTLDPNHDVLAPGAKIRRGRFKCKALDASEIKCVNTRNGHGFEVSRERAELF
jgi:hypothetical protein